MNKRTYRSKEIKRINWNKLKESLSGEEIAVAIDVAKQKQFALLTNKDASVSELFYWQHPVETPQMLDAIRVLACPVTVIVESTQIRIPTLRANNLILLSTATINQQQERKEDINI